MKIETKFKPKDKVFFVKYCYYKEKCNICNGKGKVIIKKENFKCPKCNGTRLMAINKKWQMIEGYSFQGISKINNDFIAILCNSICIDIELIHRTEYILLKDCFATKEEAQKECDKRNGKI